MDVCAFTPEQVQEHRIRMASMDCLWLAERIEDESTRDIYLSMGFDLFQGYFFAKPSLLSLGISPYFIGNITFFSEDVRGSKLKA